MKKERILKRILELLEDVKSFPHDCVSTQSRFFEIDLQDILKKRYASGFKEAALKKLMWRIEWYIEDIKNELEVI